MRCFAASALSAKTLMSYRCLLSIYADSQDCATMMMPLMLHDPLMMADVYARAVRGAGAEKRRGVRKRVYLNLYAIERVYLMMPPTRRLCQRRAHAAAMS